LVTYVAAIKPVVSLGVLPQRHDYEVEAGPTPWRWRSVRWRSHWPGKARRLRLAPPSSIRSGPDRGKHGR